MMYEYDDDDAADRLFFLYTAGSYRLKFIEDEKNVELF